MRPIAMLLFAWAGTANAVDITVSRTDDPPPDGCSAQDCSLREAVLLANFLEGADRVLLPASALPYQLVRPGAGESAGQTGDLDVADTLEIVGLGASKVVIAQLAADRIVETYYVLTLRNLSLRNGNGVDAGGAVLAYALLTGIDVEFVGNTAATSGGAIRAAHAALSPQSLGLDLLRARFEDNVAERGGAIAAETSAPAAVHSRIVDSEFVANRATTAGGAIVLPAAVYPCVHTVIGSRFVGNRVSAPAARGGAIAAENAGVELSVSNSRFEDNGTVAASGLGGAIHGADAISGSVFLRNEAGYGGAVHAVAPQIDGSEFCDNLAEVSGGAVRLESGAIARSTFCRNSAAVRGGAMYGATPAADSVEITLSTFDANTAPLGGAIAQANGALDLVQTTLAQADPLPAGQTATLLRYEGPADTDAVALVGNILRGSCGFAAGADAVTLAYYNVQSGGDTCGLFPIDFTHNINTAYAQHASIPLGALSGNGGPTRTRLLVGPTHPALDRMPPGSCLSPDQRGRVRSDDLCDAGSVEMSGVVPPAEVFTDGFED